MTINLYVITALVFVAGFSSGAAFILFAVRRSTDAIVYLFLTIVCLIALLYFYAIGAIGALV